ncbi:F-box protein At5g49610-like [Magnolia sinica]|uniref:F-box protein At5g49610-like n=1 Tax=Magnolia sinica TaxID=86752 RepID=UPI00265968AE|nr:F-box protein At5g49610-like [Magnolia sinica]
MEIAKNANDSTKAGPKKEKESLPYDLIPEILTRVPFEYLHTCRLVCKDWESIIHESSFMQLHSERTRTISGFFIQRIVSNRFRKSFISLYQSPNILQPSIDFLPEDVRIMASSRHGLLCCVSEQIQEGRIGKYWQIPRYYICKPVTKEWRQIPNPKTRYFTERVALVVQSSKPLHYKLVRFSWPRHTMSYLQCEIFNSDSWTWKRSENIPLPDLALLLPGPGVLIQGEIHWLTTENSIFAFNTDSESWRMIALPREGPNYLNGHDRVYVDITEFKGKLALIYSNNVWMELWAMENHSEEIWERKQAVSFSRALQTEYPFFSLLALYATEILLLNCAYDFIWYNFENDTYTDEMKWDYLTPQTALPFESDLVPCNM